MWMLLKSQQFQTHSFIFLFLNSISPEIHFCHLVLLQKATVNIWYWGLSLKVPYYPPFYTWVSELLETHFRSFLPKYLSNNALLHVYIPFFFSPGLNGLCLSVALNPKEHWLTTPLSGNDLTWALWGLAPMLTVNT